MTNFEKYILPYLIYALIGSTVLCLVAVCVAVFIQNGLWAGLTVTSLFLFTLWAQMEAA